MTLSSGKHRHSIIIPHDNAASVAEDLSSSTETAAPSTSVALREGRTPPTGPSTSKAHPSSVSESTEKIGNCQS